MSLSNNFTEGKILKPLLLFAGPVLLAMFLQSLYGAVDLLIIGQFASTSDVSAVSTGSMLMQSVTTCLASFSMGITILIGQKIGEGKAKEAGKVIGSGIFLFAVLAIIFTGVFVSLSRTLAGMLNAPEEAFEATVQYIRICSWGILFILAFNAVGGIFRGLGDSKLPLLTVAIACTMNIFGDLLLVAVFHLGAAGAALATVVAQAFSVFISLWIIRKKELPFTMTIRDIRPIRIHIARILRLGIPIAFQDLLVSLSFLVIMRIVNALGLEQSAGVGVAEKVCGFLMLVPSAFSQSLAAFVAQNFGAGKMDRARKSLLYAVCASFAIAVVMWFMAFFHGDLLSRIFSTDPEVIAMSASYLKSYGIDCLLTAFLFCFNGYFSGLGKTTFVMAQSVAGAFFARIPVAYFISKIPGVSLFYIGLATPSSTTVQLLIYGFYLLLKHKKKLSKTH